MFDNQPLSSPTLVLVAGLGATALGTALVYTGAEVNGAELSRAVAVAVLSVCGATSMAACGKY